MRQSEQCRNPSFHRSSLASRACNNKRSTNQTCSRFNQLSKIATSPSSGIDSLRMPANSPTRSIGGFGSVMRAVTPLRSRMMALALQSAVVTRACSLSTSTLSCHVHLPKRRAGLRVVVSRTNQARWNADSISTAGSCMIYAGVLMITICSRHPRTPLSIYGMPSTCSLDHCWYEIHEFNFKGAYSPFLFFIASKQFSMRIDVDFFLAHTVYACRRLFTRASCTAQGSIPMLGSHSTL